MTYGAHLTNPIRSTGVRPNPLLRATYYLDNSATSSYASWQTTLRKRYSHNLSASVHYTWGKALAYNGGDIGTWYQGDNTPRVQDFNNIRAEHAPATGDITHSFVAQAVYDLPKLANFNARSAPRSGRLADREASLTPAPASRYRSRSREACRLPVRTILAGMRSIVTIGIRSNT